MAMTLLHRDLFNRANGSNVGVDYNEQQGDFEISSSEIRTVGAVEHVLAWKGDVLQPDYRVEVKDVEAAQNDKGPALRIQTGATPDLYYVDFTAGTTMRIRKRVSGVHTTIASTAGVTRTAGKVIRAECQGTALRAWYDGTLRVSGTDGVITAKGSAGLYANGTLQRFDELHIYGDDEWTLVPNAYTLGWKWNNEVVAYESGFVQRNELWRRPVAVLAMGYEVASDAEKKTVQSFFHRRRGRAVPFLVKDPTLTSPVTEVFAVGDGVTTKYKVLADWATAITTYTNGTVDSPQPSFDLMNGLVTYAAAPANGAALSADVTNAKYRCHFAEDEHEFERRIPLFWKFRVTFVQDKVMLDGVPS